MKLRTLMALAVAAAFAAPLAAQASVDGDRMIVAQAGGPAGSSATGTGPTGGVPSPRTAGEPQAPTSQGGASAGVSTAHCDSMSGAAREKCLSDAAAGASSSAGGSVGSGGGSSTGSSTTGTTAGPGSASNQTGSGSATATTPSTSGHGKAQ